MSHILRGQINLEVDPGQYMLMWREAGSLQDMT